MKPAHRRSVPGDPFFTAESPRRLGTYAAPDVAQDMIRACAGHVVQRASINQRHGRLPPPPWIPRPRAAASPAEVGVASGKSQDEPARTLQYHGVPVPSAGWRALLVPPKPETRDPRFNPGCEVRRQAIDEGQEGSKPKGTWRRRNYPWALLVRRVFACDVLACDHCGGRMRVVAAIQAPDAIRRILECLGLPSRAPPMAGALPDRDMEDHYIS